MSKHEIVFLAAKRTPIGALLGNFTNFTAPELGAIAHIAALKEANLKPDDIGAVVSGCVLQAGIGQAPARQAAIKAGLPYNIPAATVNKMCGSGLESVILASEMIAAESYKIMLASGMESMTNAPYLLKKARSGFRIGHGEIKDHMFLDGLEDAYQKNTLMGVFAEQTAKHYNFTREEQDAFAIASMNKALAAQKSSAFADEITPVTTMVNKAEKIITLDESPDETKIAKVAKLKPAFDANGTVTAANSSSIADGAASVILTSREHADAQKLKPIARLAAFARYSHEPQWFTTAPVGAIKAVVLKAGWQMSEVDVFEINEAFAVVTMAAIKDLNLNPDSVNIHGGACALGHPIGASGTRILVTLINALRCNNKKRGVAALCIGGGEAVAVAIEIE
jgi:acetyl-CoA C-acetyltransferase